jgi:hypothetical protein
MLVFELVRWWYSDGWLKLGQNFGLRLRQVYQMFSVPILLTTLFAPWKRIVTYPGQGLNEKMRAMIDNLVSRFVGFGVRILVIIAALVSLAVIALLGLVSFVIWPLVPIGAIFLIVSGVSHV